MPKRSGMDSLNLGQFRPIYLWGGPGTRRMLRIKFMNAPVDDKIYDLAHSIEGAEMVAQMGFNWAFLAFNWGFPPEIEEQDWESFRSAVIHYHKAGVKIFGYVQSSNCVYQGSYIEKDWYALDPYGRKIPYFRGRYYTSLSNATWLAEVRERVRKIIEAGVDGIFFDNAWVGGTGIDVAEMPLGPIGAYDEHSRRAYSNAFNGAEIPLVLDTRDAATRQYLRWRADIAAAAVRDWSQTARDLNPSVVITANNYDVIASNSYVAMGVDIENMASVQDVMIVPSFALPRLQEDNSVVANAITIGAVQSRVGNKPVATLPQRDGVGVERMATAKQLSRAMAESAALNAPMVVNGTGYLHRNEFTSLLHSRYEPQRRVIGAMNHWLTEHHVWLSERVPISPLAIYHPYEAVRWDWIRIAPIFFAACEALIQNGYPLRIVSDDDDWSGVKILIVPPGQIDGLDQHLAQFVEQGGRVIALGQSRPAATKTIWEGWRPLRHRIPHIRQLRIRVNQGAMICWRAYHRHRLSRWLAVRLKLQEAMNHSPLYILPPPALQSAILDAIGRDFYPRVESDGPILLTLWEEKDGTHQLHLVNYQDTPQRVTIHLDELTGTWVYTPGVSEPPNKVVGSSIMLGVDVAKVLRSPHEEIEQ
ncbi:MAG: hypothetical protein K8L91_19395 [Anaerolineae bacterium]|nr:hypothetical protein [Anaerolineae bacterium]